MELKRTGVGIPLADLPTAKEHGVRTGTRHSTDEIEYISDMILELNQMSVKAGWTMLAAILGLAHLAAIQHRNAMVEPAGHSGDHAQS